MSKKRDAEFDIVKGILILCVVIGHGGSDSIADFMYRFHIHEVDDPVFPVYVN